MAKGMSMGFLILIGIIIWGWAEITAFILIGDEIGGLLTFLGVFATAVVGVWLLKRQGARVMANLRAQVTRGEAPMAPVAESLSLLMGGILMLIPGYVTDAIGLMMFIPGLRTIFGLIIMERLLRNARFRHFAQAGQTASGAGFYQSYEETQTDIVIDGEAEERPVRPDELPRQ
jgi:UPF0716 protein FxsA